MISTVVNSISECLDDPDLQKWFLGIPATRDNLRDSVQNGALTQSQYNLFLKSIFFDMKNKLVEAKRIGSFKRGCDVIAFSILRKNQMAILNDAEPRPIDDSDSDSDTLNLVAGQLSPSQD